ncbi:MAG TPA: alpha-galactosidase [Firmicutes bacterium]|nr:alpha-galactosidase [Bacillota bacterium]
MKENSTTLYEFIKSKLLSGFAADVSCIRGVSGRLAEFSEEIGDDSVVVTFKPEYGLERFAIRVDLSDNSAVLSLDAKIPVQNGAYRGFSPEHAVSFTLGDVEPDALLGSHHDCPWWMYPAFVKSFDELKPRTQSLLVKSGEQNYYMLPLTGDNFYCEINSGRLYISSDTSGICRLTGAFLAVSVSADPYKAVDDCFKYAREVGAIRVPLKAERTLPELFRGFGWCTWDAFYAKVTSKGIFEKLDEFREKNIPVKWVIIDDGWIQNRDSRLTSFEENREKFPEGFKATIARMKEEYGVEKVGVWHAFNGYWNGVDPNSALYYGQRDNLDVTPSGVVVPSFDEDKAFRFWDSWHSYLASVGVDFVKVDNQSSNSAYINGALPTAEGCRKAHNALERSVYKNFGGAIINCMGMDMENVLARPHSAVSRNSDDFFPRRERGFVKHLVQNVYNAIWHGQLYYCDFDMWWSDHESAVQSGVLRAISGSPIYVSDEVNKSSRDAILPVVEDDGRVMLCDNAARPTLDCMYGFGDVLTIWNQSGGSFGGTIYGAAAFNLSDSEVKGSLAAADIPGLDGDYVAYEYFTKKFTRVNKGSLLDYSLGVNGVAVWSIYPVLRDDSGEYILLGDVSKYLPIASGHKVKTAVLALGI